MDADTKIARAITKLAIHHPFFGSVAFRLDIHEDNTKPTMCTNGRFIKWNRSFVDRHTEKQVLGVLVHEIYHVVLKHMLRRGDRDGKRWNYACDYTINPMVLDEKEFELPPDGLMDPKYDGKWMAERVYEDLPDQLPDMGGGGFGEVIDMDNEDGSQMSSADVAAAEIEIDEMVQTAADMARKAGKLPANVEVIIKEMAESQIDWRDKFQRFAGGVQPDDYSRRRYSKRYYAAYGVVAPSVEKVGIGNIAIGWDVSGSVYDKEHSHFLGELNAFIEDNAPESVTIIFCDMRVLHVQRLEQGEMLDEVAIRGKGGTLVEPVFDYVEEHLPDIERMIFLTDMGFHVDPVKYAPRYPMMWLSTVAGVKAPFGEIAYVKV